MTPARTLGLPAAAVLAFGIAAVDQAVKAVVVATMAYGERIALVPFFDLLHARNFGVSFSLLGGLPSAALVALTGLIGLFMVWLLARSDPRDIAARIGLSMIIGGALGNLIDRVRLGYVTDYFFFHTPVFSFAVFNIADVAITCGAALLILDEVVLKRRGGDNPKGEQDG